LLIVEFARARTFPRVARGSLLASGLTSLAILAAVGCGASARAGSRTQAAPVPRPERVTCASSVFHSSYPLDRDRAHSYRRVFPNVWVGPAVYGSRRARDLQQGWNWYAKEALFLRDGGPPVTLTIPRSSRGTGGMTWGSSTITESLRVSACPSVTAGTSGWSGGFYFHTSKPLCLPVNISAGGRSKRIWFGFGKRCP
jgi:hypothetical protein